MKIKMIFFSIAILILFGIWFYSYTPACDGIDVSRYNNIGNSVLRDENIKFIIAKATEGCNMEDIKFRKHKDFAKKHGIKFGAYHFLTKTSPISMQFENYKKTVGRDIDIIPCVDIEQTNGKHWRREEARKVIKEWSDLCLSYYGKYPIIYCNDFYRIFYFHDMPNQFWISNWYSRPFTKCAIHQYTSNNETLDYNYLQTDIKNICFD